MYQTIAVPDGIIMHLYGPVDNRQPDNVMYARSGLEKLLEEKLFINGKKYCIYGYADYVLREWLITAFTRSIATEEQRDFNKYINRASASVE